MTGRSALRLLVGLLLIVTTACGVPQDELPRALTPAEVPYASAAASAVPDTAGDRVAELFLVRDGQVVPTPRNVDGPLPIEGLVELLFGGTTQEERDAGFISVIPSTLAVADVEVQGNTAVLTLEGPDAEVQRTSPLAYAQIVATLSPSRVAGVRFRLDGRDLDVPRGDGSLSNGPLSREDFAELLEPPPPSAAVPVPAADPSPAA